MNGSDEPESLEIESIQWGRILIVIIIILAIVVIYKFIKSAPSLDWDVPEFPTRYDPMRQSREMKLINIGIGVIFLTMAIKVLLMSNVNLSTRIVIAGFILLLQFPICGFNFFTSLLEQGDQKLDISKAAVLVIFCIGLARLLKHKK